MAVSRRPAPRWPMLNPARVHTIRTEPRPDPYYARLWRVHVQTIRAARVGDTWRDVPTPPDTAPRDHHGKWCGLTEPQPAEQK